MKRIVTITCCLIGLAMLSGCASNSGVTSVPGVGPVLSSEYGKTATSVAGNLPQIDVIVPIFDPNLPDDEDELAEKGIYAELRRAESTRFAVKMKAALQDTEAFGTVRVAPATTATGDLYLSGKIIESNGEDVHIHITATDISGREWFAKTFKHRVKESFHNNLRNKGKDAYDPVFEKAAEYVVKQLNKRKAAQLEKLQLISELRFGSSLSEETFAKYLTVQGGRVAVASTPSDDDPQLLRIQPIRVKDQLFLDNMQTHYADFNHKLDESYRVWQQQSLVEVKAARKARKKAIGQGILGGLLAVAAIAATVAGADPNNSKGTDTALGAAAIGAGIGAAVAIGASFQNRKEMKVHREAISELGQSLDIELAPQVIEYENQTTKLEGDAAQQYTQWIAFLKKIYALEATPDKKL